jgi:hypothetical protein
MRNFKNPLYAMTQSEVAKELKIAKPSLEGVIPTSDINTDNLFKDESKSNPVCIKANSLLSGYNYAKCGEDTEKWLKTGGDYIKKFPEYKEAILNIKALNKLIEVAKSIRDFNSISIFSDSKQDLAKIEPENENKSILETQVRGLELLVPMLEGDQKNIIEKQIRGLKLLINIV